LTEYFPNEAYAEKPFEIPVVEPRKTFLEKTFLLHEEFAKAYKGRIRHERMSRHFCDLVCSMRNGVSREALADHALYKQLVRHPEWYRRLHWVDYSSLSRERLSFLPPDKVIDLYRADYSTMREHMIYREAPDFDQITQELKELQIQFRENR
jgi:Nucleotidyl transferase AbiEii toxin, Type IV TA system